MAAYKFYEWERATFPWAHKVMIPADLRVELTFALARAWGVYLADVRLTTSGGGWAYHHNNSIALPRERLRCSLAIIVHEITHHLTAGSHHNKDFKAELCKRYAEVKHFKPLAKIIREIFEARKRRAALRDKARAKQERRVLAAAKSVATRNSTGARLDKRREQLRRLERKAKALATRIKTAKKDVRALERKQNQG